MIYLLIYYLLALVPVIWCQLKYPPYFNKGVHLMIAIVFAGWLWPISVRDLWRRWPETTDEFLRKQDEWYL